MSTRCKPPVLVPGLRAVSAARGDTRSRSPRGGAFRVLAVAILLAASISGCGPKPPPSFPAHPSTELPESLSAAGTEILKRMATTYAAAATYRDSGVVRTEFVRNEGTRFTERPFMTAFVRPDRFRFEFTDTRASGQSTRYIVWRGGSDVATWWDVGARLERGLSLGLALAGATGVSGGSAHAVPRLLMPDEVDGWALTDLQDAQRAPDDNVDGVRCFRVRGRNLDDPIVVWVGQSDYLLRLIESSHRFDDFTSRTSAHYSPVANAEVRDDLLQFAPPSTPLQPQGRQP